MKLSKDELLKCLKEDLKVWCVSTDLRPISRYWYSPQPPIKEHEVDGWMMQNCTFYLNYWEAWADYCLRNRIQND